MLSKQYEGKTFFVNDTSVPRGQVVILHGICEHSLRHIELSNTLQSQDFSSAFIDHPGHGLQLSSGPALQKAVDGYLNESSPEQLSSAFAHYKNTQEANQFQEEFQTAGKNLSLNDIIHFQLSFIKFLFSERIFCPKTPLLLYGQSMGGLIAAELCHKLKEENIEVAGMIFLSPAFDAIAAPPKGNRALHKLSHKLEECILNSSRKACFSTTLFGISLLPAFIFLNPNNNTSWISDYTSDIDQQKKINRQDPLIGHAVSLRFRHSILKTMMSVQAKAARFPCDFFIAYGENDKIVNSLGADVFCERYLKTHSPCQSKIIKLQKFEPHELLRSSVKNEIQGAILEWLYIMIPKRST
jgi:alpha-beta hydrolase superfamily lysophospholipase